MADDKLPSVHELYKKTFVTIQTPNHKKKFTGSSVAARHTTVIDKDNGIVMDAGMISYEMRHNYRVLLITHGHSDHSLGIPQMYRDEGDKKLIIFCPDSICEDVFMRIKSFLQMQKGRKYSTKEIMQRLEIYAVRIVHKTKTEFEKSIEKEKEIKYDGYKIADIIEYDDVIDIVDSDKKFCIRPFPCFHTVDTCGFSIEKVDQKLKDYLVIKSGKKYKVNLTQDQPRRITKAEKKMMKKNPDLVINTNVEYDFSDIIQFCDSNSAKIDYNVNEIILESGHVLYQRNIEFKDDFKLKIDSNLTDSDFKFFERYGINIFDKVVIPETLFFGDTSNVVFKNRYVHKLLKKTKNVIIECTFLENRKDLSDKQRKKRNKTDHMFLEDLIPIFDMYKDVDFVLMHFSARYKKKDIINKFDKISRNNVSILL